MEVPSQLIAAMTNNPRDHHVIAAAIVANAKVIVTVDMDGFPTQALDPWGIEAWHADDFLVYLDEQNPGTMIKIIWEQSNQLKVPKSVPEIIDKLETTNLNRKNRVPKFTHTIRCQFYGDVIVQIAKKALNIGIVAPEGERYYEGTRYRLWQKGEILTVTAKGQSW